jgi:hypothetical protein
MFTYHLTRDEYKAIINEFVFDKPNAIKLQMKICVNTSNARSVLSEIIDKWEKENGVKNVIIKFIESDTYIKRILKHKITGIEKIIIQELYYDSGWYWLGDQLIDYGYPTVMRSGL